MRVFITGNKGYIGAVMTPMVLAAGHEVVGLDSDLYRDCTFGEEPLETPTLYKDIRDVTPDDLAGFDAVIHLAALSNDPLGNLDRNLTLSINYEGSVHLARMAKQAGVARFLFSSSCSLYGAGGNDMLTEEAEFNPVTVYGETKVMAERDIAALADDDFSPTFFRNATAYGLSSRHRFDLVLNNLVAWAVATGNVHIKSDGTPWRPIVHIADISAAYLAALAAPREVVHNQALNVGANGENYRIRELATIVQETVPGSQVTFAADASPDLRNYRVNFDKIHSLLPGFQPQWTARRGAQQLYEAYQRLGVTLEEFEGPKYRRVDHIKLLLAEGVIDASLRRTTAIADSPLAEKVGGVTKIALFGVFANGNLGNDATLEAMLANLAIWAPDAEVCCICPDPPAVHRRYGIAAIPIDVPPAPGAGHSLGSRVLHLGGRVRQEIALWGESAARLEGVDHLLIAGTGVLDDFGVRPWNLPYDLYKWCTLARRAGARLSFVSVGAGPIVQRASRWLMTSALRKAHYRSYRDQQSKEYLAGIGFDTQPDKVYPDLVFSLPPAKLPAHQPPAAPPRTVGVGVMGYYGWSNSPEAGEAIYAEYVAKLSRFCAWLAGEGYAVHLLAGETPTDERPRHEIMELLRGMLDAQSLARVAVPPIEKPDDVLAAVAATDLVVATRFHNVVAGLMLGRPVISIGYAKKNDVLLADMGLGEFCQHAETLEVERLQAQFCTLAAVAGPAAERICNRVHEYRRQLDAQYAHLFGS